MDSFSSRNLHYAAAIGCGVFAALAVHIALSVFGLGIDALDHRGLGASRRITAIATSPTICKVAELTLSGVSSGVCQ